MLKLEEMITFEEFKINNMVLYYEKKITFDEMMIKNDKYKIQLEELEIKEIIKKGIISTNNKMYYYYKLKAKHQKINKQHCYVCNRDYNDVNNNFEKHIFTKLHDKNAELFDLII